jgi:FkbM family methyltransferase
MEYLLGIVKNIYKHPLTRRRKLKTFLKFLEWEFFSRTTGYKIIFPFIDNSKLIINSGMDGATGNIIFGLMEYTDMGFLLHFLRESDTFIDIGANVGVYTVLASAVKKAQTISVEPIPTTFSHLIENIRVNKIEKLVTPYNIGLGDEETESVFTTSLDVVNHVITKADQSLDTIKVQIKKLDNLISKKIPVLIKIDVEGYETKVLQGAENLLSDKRLKGIIIELNGSGERYGFDESEIHKKLLALDFKAYHYEPKQRLLSEKNGLRKANNFLSYGEYNTIYLRDIDFISQRVKEATPFKINEYFEFI